MRLNESGLKDRSVWEQAGFRLPAYDREKVEKATKRCV